MVSVLFSALSLLGASAVYWVLMSNFLYHSVKYIYGELPIIFTLHNFKEFTLLLFHLSAFYNFPDRMTPTSLSFTADDNSSAFNREQHHKLIVSY